MLRNWIKCISKISPDDVRDILSLLDANFLIFDIAVIGRLWEYVKDTGALSVDTWKLIASTGITRDEEAASYICPLLMRHNTWAHKTQPLAAYLEPLISDTFDFLTHLTITGMVRCDAPELLRLIQLKNLAVLEIIESPDDERSVWEGPRLTDSIVREWSKSPDPFPVLRVLRVWGHDYTTINSLRYITAFPSLVLYDVAGRKRDWKGKGEQSVWNSKSKTWQMDLDFTLSEHYGLLTKGIPADRRKPAPDPLLNVDVILADEIGLTSFQRDKYEAYERSFEADWNIRFLICQSPSFTMPCMCSSRPKPSAWLQCNSLWGFLMCCQIGTLTLDQDLLAQGLELGERAFAQREVILPPRPMLNLILGEVPYVRGPENREQRPAWDACEHITHNNVPLHRGAFETQLTFVRTGRHPEDRDGAESTIVQGKAAKRPLDASASTTYKPRKKPMSVSSILDTF